LLDAVSGLALISGQFLSLAKSCQKFENRLQLYAGQHMQQALPMGTDASFSSA